MDQDAETSAASCAELLIRLTRTAAERTYRAELSFTQPGSEAPTEPDPGTLTLDLDALSEVLNDADEYGRRLTSAFFADDSVKDQFEQFQAVADARGSPMRLRLHFDGSAPELQGVRWETLRDPSGGLLSASERIYFSRWVPTSNYRSVKSRPRGQLSVLIVIVSPPAADLAQYAPEDPAVPLQPLDVTGELQRTRAVLGDARVTPLVSPGATLARLSQELRLGYDVVYLICHGAMFHQQPILYLEGEDSRVAPTSAAELADLFVPLRELPRLVVLAACQSAGSGAKGALAAVGPLLARMGVPSVLAMQGRVSIETADAFMGTFFAELVRDGQIDRAASVARTQVKTHPDAWMPVLFTRQKSGRIWSTGPASAGSQSLLPWDGLIDRIKKAKCMPIVGPGMVEFLLGRREEIAERWAAQFDYPMQARDREDLARVAQFLAINASDPAFPRDQLLSHLEQEMLERYEEQLKGHPSGDLDQLVAEIGRQRRAADPSEPYRVLANLPLTIYISTNPDNLLADALREAGKDPQVELCRWKDDVDWPASIFEVERDYWPDVSRPLVYHLFGQLRVPESLVLTEDDYFDYLVGVTRNDPMGPAPLFEAWPDFALMFLGFEVEQWQFRLLFRGIVKQGGDRQLKQRPHVAVQLDPDEGTSLDPLRAKRYLEQYFASDAIKIYWGTGEAFVRELWERWTSSRAARTRP